MKKFYLTTGTIICILFAFSSYRGIPFTQAMNPSEWKPKGKPTHTAGSSSYRRGGFHRFYHK